MTCYSQRHCVWPPKLKNVNSTSPYSSTTQGALFRFIYAHVQSKLHRLCFSSIITSAFKTPTEAKAEAFVKAYFDAVTEEDFDQALTTNAVGPYWLTFAFLPLLEKWKNSPGGERFAPQIVMTSSMNGWTKVHLPSPFSFDTSS